MALLTDCSVSQDDVAGMERVIAELAPGCFVLNMMEALAAGSVFAGQRLLLLTVPQFPPGSIFVLVVGAAEDTPWLALSSGAAVFIGPDNGLFTL